MQVTSIYAALLVEGAFVTPGITWERRSQHLMSLRIINPNIAYSGCVLIVYDEIEDPFYFSADNFEDESGKRRIV